MTTANTLQRNASDLTPEALIRADAAEDGYDIDAQRAKELRQELGPLKASIRKARIGIRFDDDPANYLSTLARFSN